MRFLIVCAWGRRRSRGPDIDGKRRSGAGAGPDSLGADILLGRCSDRFNGSSAATCRHRPTISVISQLLSSPPNPRHNRRNSAPRIAPESGVGLGYSAKGFDLHSDQVGGLHDMAPSRGFPPPRDQGIIGKTGRCRSLNCHAQRP